MSKATIPTPVRINWEEASFKGASGKTYHIVDTLPIDYWIEYQRYVPELAYGVDFRNLHTKLNEAYTALTSGNEILKGIRLAADILYNLMSSVKNFATQERIHPCLLMATCWCIREDEEMKSFDPQLAKEKIKDWREAGIAIEDFFLLSSVKIAHFREIYSVYREDQNEAKEVMSKETLQKTGRSNTTSNPSKDDSGATR